VAALKSGQNPAWKWIGDEGTPDLSRRQPPVVTPEGRLYILAGRRLIALQDGRSRWVQSEEEDGFSFATAFVDGLLLAAAGRRLIGFDAEGNTLFDVEFEESIIAPPVGAGDGSILLLTATKLLRVR
jgi:hypothetical protein